MKEKHFVTDGGGEESFEGPTELFEKFNPDCVDSIPSIRGVQSEFAMYDERVERAHELFEGELEACAEGRGKLFKLLERIFEGRMVRCPLPYHLCKRFGRDKAEGRVESMCLMVAVDGHNEGKGPCSVFFEIGDIGSGSQVSVRIDTSELHRVEVLDEGEEVRCHIRGEIDGVTIPER